MPITVQCPNDTCAKSLRVPDAAAGKTGKCPACGTRIAIPASAADPEPDEFAVLEPVAPAKPAAAPAWPSDPGPASIKPNPAAVALGVFRFEAFGEAWRSFKQQAGVWIAATLIVGFASAGVQLVLNLLAIPITLVGGAILPRGIFFFTSLGSMAVSMAVSGIFLGGMYSMALKQVDGRTIGVKDLVPSTDILPSLALASVLATLASLVGFLCLVIPGWIIWGLFLFTLPLVVDRRVKATDAMGMSWTTLKSQWLQATVFVLVLWALQIGGMLLCLVGSLVTFPLCVLSQAILYRGFFTPKGAPVKLVQAMDPDFGPVGAELGHRPKGRIPAWAWLVAVTGLLVPVVATSAAIALMVALAVSATRGFQQNAGNPQAFQDAFPDLEKRGGNPGAPENKFADEMRKMSEEQKKAGVDLGEELRKSMKAQKKAAADVAEETPNPAGTERQQAVAKRANNTRKTAGAKAGAANPADITALVGDLTSDDAGVRRGALDRLARSAPTLSHHDEVIKALEPFLADEQAAMRAAAVKALAVWANADDVPALIAALDDEDRAVRRAAIQAFGRIKDERAIEPVARQLADPDGSVQNDAVRVLRQIGSIAEEEVVKYLDSADPRTCEHACQVLQSIGTKESVRALTQAATGKSPVARFAQAALRSIAARERTK
jgi:hypothetical protein